MIRSNRRLYRATLYRCTSSFASIQKTALRSFGSCSKTMLKNKCYINGEGTLQVPVHMNYGREVLENMIKNKDKVALINSDIDESITYGELAQQTVDIALSLARMGVGKGDVISICSEKRFEFLATVLGIFCAGATFSSADPTFGSTTILRRVNIARPKMMFCSSSTYKAHIDAFRSADCIETYVLFGDVPQDGAILFKDFLTEHASIEEFQPAPVDGIKDNLLILFSSGTTGLPKGIPVTHLSGIISFRHVMTDCDKEKQFLNTREWYYTYGLHHVLACLSHGTTVIYCHEYNLESFLKAIQKYKIEQIVLTPTTVNELVKSPIVQNYDVTSLEVIISASITMTADAIAAVKNKLPNIKRVTQFYGMTEAGVICSDLHVPSGLKPGSIGTAFPGFIIKVVDLDTREPLGPNQRGEICYKSPTVTSGYLGSDNEDSFKDEEGFFKTGDIGYYDEDRCFFIVDRLKELIKFNDYAIAPAELEGVLEQHACVLEAGVVGAPHAEWGQVAVGFVVLRPGTAVTEEILVEYVNSQVAHRTRLAGGIRFVKSLPRGGSGKLDRKALKLLLN